MSRHPLVLVDMPRTLLDRIRRRDGAVVALCARPDCGWLDTGTVDDVIARWSDQACRALA